MNSMKELHKMPLLLPQFKKLIRDSNGHTIGKSNLNLLKELGVSWELIFQNISREVFSLTVPTTEMSEPWSESIQIQSNTSIIKLSRLWLWKEDTSVSQHISTISIFSWNKSMSTISWETFLHRKFGLLEPITTKSISTLLQMISHSNFSSVFSHSSLVYGSFIWQDFDGKNTGVKREERKGGATIEDSV